MIYNDIFSQQIKEELLPEIQYATKVTNLKNMVLFKNLIYNRFSVNDYSLLRFVGLAVIPNEVGNHSPALHKGNS